MAADNTSSAALYRLMAWLSPSYPVGAFSYSSGIEWAVETGDIKGALEQLPLRYSDVPMLSDAGLVYAHAGKRDDALREVARLEQRESEGYGVSYEIAIIHAALGQIPEACAALRQAPDDHSQTLGWLKLDPRMDPLRDQACYAEVMQRLWHSP